MINLKDQKLAKSRNFRLSRRKTIKLLHELECGKPR